MRVAPADHGLGIRLQGVGLQEVLDEPLDRAVREVLERARRHRLARSQLGEQRPAGERTGHALLAARAGGGERAVPLGGSGSVVGGPGHIRQRARAGLRRAEQLAGVLYEERLRLRVALLVARARRQHEQPLGARGADVEEVALAVEGVLAHGQHEPGGACDRAPVLVGQERLRSRAARELALLQAADEHGLEAARADRLRRRDLDAVGLRVLAHVHLELLEHAVDTRGVDPAAARTAGAQDVTQRGQRRLALTEGARLVELRAAQKRGLALVRRREQTAEARLELGHERVRVASPREPVELAQLEALLLPQRAGMRGAVGPLLADGGLEPVGQAGHVQSPWGAQVGEQVVGAAAERGAADQRQQAAPDAGVAERDATVDRVRNPVGAEHLLEQGGVRARPPEHHGHVPGHDALAQQLEDARPGELDLGALAAGVVERDRGARVDRLAGLLEQAPFQVVEGGARALHVVHVDRLERQLGGAAGEQLLPDAGGGPEGLAAGLERQRHAHVGAAAARDRLERIELERGEVVEPVDEQGRAAPCVRIGPQGVERAPAEHVGVDEAGAVEPRAVAAVDGRDLLRVGAPRAIARPIPQRPGEAGGVDHRAAQLRHEARRGAHEAGLRGRLGEHVEARCLHRLLDDQLALDVRGHPLAVARAARDLLEEPAEAQDVGAEHGPALGQLALGMLDVPEGGHEQDRVLGEPRPQPAQHLAGLRGVSRSCYERERHDL